MRGIAEAVRSRAVLFAVSLTERFDRLATNTPFSYDFGINREVYAIITFLTNPRLRTIPRHLVLDGDLVVRRSLRVLDPHDS